MRRDNGQKFNKCFRQNKRQLIKYKMIDEINDKMIILIS
jgi:hypothetical protein